MINKGLLAPETSTRSRHLYNCHPLNPSGGTSRRILAFFLLKKASTSTTSQTLLRIAHRANLIAAFSISRWKAKSCGS